MSLLVLDERELKKAIVFYVSKNYKVGDLTGLIQFRDMENKIISVSAEVQLEEKK